MKQLKLFCLIITLFGLIPGNSVWARGEHGGGGHKGGKHFSGGHKGGKYFSGGHKGRRHYGGGHKGRRHYGIGYKGRRHFGGFGGFGGYRGYGYPVYGYDYPRDDYGYPEYGNDYPRDDYDYPEYGGGYGDSYPPEIYIEQEGNTRETTNSQTNYSRYCGNPEGYYPHIKKCPGGWIKAFPPLSPPQ